MLVKNLKARTCYIEIASSIAPLLPPLVPDKIRRTSIFAHCIKVTDDNRVPILAELPIVYSWNQKL